ncbi:hypothetical protein R6M67_10875, partial [Streptomyces sp. Wh19]|nr:hypothetical protein [Streptomyces sp. Wh19]
MKLSERGTGRVTEGLEADERECTGVSATGDERECAGAKQAFGGLLVVTAALGLLGSLVITIDKFELLADPDFVPACSLSLDPPTRALWITSRKTKKCLVTCDDGSSSGFQHAQSARHFR